MDWTDNPVYIALASIGFSALVGLIGWVLKEVRGIRIDLVKHMGDEIAGTQVQDTRLEHVEHEVTGISTQIASLGSEFRAGLSRVHDRVDVLASRSH